jgi:hypothetical protein
MDSKCLLCDLEGDMKLQECVANNGRDMSKCNAEAAKLAQLHAIRRRDLACNIHLDRAHKIGLFCLSAVICKGKLKP